MSMFGLVRQKMAQAKEYRRSKIQASAEKRAVILEKEAEHAKKLKVELERQEKARKEIAEVKEMKRARIKKKIGAIRSGIKQFKKDHGPGPEFGLGSKGSGSGPEFGLGSKKDSPTDIKVKKGTW